MHGELSRQLVNDIHSMGMAYTWFSANTRAGYHSDTSRDRDWYTIGTSIYIYIYSIHSTVELVGVKFLKINFNRFSKLLYRTICKFTLGPNCASTHSCWWSMWSESELAFNFPLPCTGFTTGINVFGIGGEVNVGAQFRFSESFTLVMRNLLLRQWLADIPLQPIHSWS